MDRYSPIELGNRIAEIVNRDKSERKYYRIGRSGRWYGGIATSDCCGCNLKCLFCWSNKPRDFPEEIGNYYSPEEICDSLVNCARKNHYPRIRISGNEPTLGKDHLLSILETTMETGLRFILETNGILIDHNFAQALGRFRHLHVRVSLKGTDEEEFEILTGAYPKFFQYQLYGLENLTANGIKCHAAVMLSFTTKEKVIKLIERLSKINPQLGNELEEEYVLLYPHVRERLKKAGLEPLVAYEPNQIPKKLV